MEVKIVKKGAFSVIGHLGSTKDGDGFIAKLWQASNERFSEIQGLIKLDKNGVPEGFWGAMSDFSLSFAPWEDNFSKGYYLAGAEVRDDAEPPEGWTKWTMPASEYAAVKVEGADTFQKGLKYLGDNKLTLAGAIYDYNDPRENGQGYMYFPIKRLS